MRGEVLISAYWPKARVCEGITGTNTGPTPHPHLQTSPGIRSVCMIASWMLTCLMTCYAISCQTLTRFKKCSKWGWGCPRGPYRPCNPGSRSQICWGLDRATENMSSIQHLPTHMTGVGLGQQKRCGSSPDVRTEAPGSARARKKPRIRTSNARRESGDRPNAVKRGRGSRAASSLKRGEGTVD